MSSKQLKDVGSHGKAELARLYPHEVITVLDKRHFMHGKVNVARYDYKGDSQIAQENREQTEDIRVNGVKFPGFVWMQKQDDGSTLNHVVAGTRRTLSLGRANRLRLKDGVDELTMVYDFKSGLTLETAIELWRMENEDRKSNDWMTKIQGAKAQRDLGIPDDVLRKKWGIPSQKTLTRMLREGGILSACKELKEALAHDRIELGKALRIADLPLDKQAEALAGKQERKPTEPKAIRMPVLRLIREAICNDKRLEDMSAGELIDALTVTESKFTDMPSIVLVRQLIAEASKPGRKSEKKPAAEPKTGSEFTDAERAMIQANNNKDIDAIEAAEEKKNKRGTRRDEDLEDGEE